MILDDRDPSVGRADARGRLDLALERPFEELEARAYDEQQQKLAWEQRYLIETQGHGAAEAEQVKDQVFASSTYGSIG